MKRKCIDLGCGKNYVTSKDKRRIKKKCAPFAGDHNLCDPCFREVCQTAHEQSYFGSISDWGMGYI